MAGRSQIGGVAESFSERHKGFQHVLEALVFNTLDNAPAALQAADYTADERFGDQNLKAHHRFEKDRSRCFQGAVKGLPGGDLESQRGAVIPPGQAAQLNPHVYHLVTLQHA